MTDKTDNSEQGNRAVGVVTVFGRLPCTGDPWRYPSTAPTPRVTVKLKKVVK